MLGRPNCWRPGVHQDLARRVIEGVGDHRFDDRDVVNDTRQVRQQLGQLGAALAMPGKLELRPQQLRVRVDERGPVSLEQFGRRQLPVELGQLRLVVEQLQMARAARHEQENYALRFGRRGRGLRGQWIDRTAGRCATNTTIHQLGQRDRTESDAALLQKPAAADAARVGVAVEMVLAVHGYSLVIVSSKFKSTRETAVQPASSSTVSPLGNAGAVLPFVTAKASRARFV